MLKLDVLRLFVDRRLSDVTDDIFRLFARTITEYEREVSRLKREIDRQRRLLEDRQVDRQTGVLQVSTTEEEQVRGRSFSPGVQQEVGGATGRERFTQSPDWLRERSETDQSPASNQIQPCSRQTDVTTQEALSVKQEVEEDHVMLEATVTAETSSQQQGVLQMFTTEEEQQLSLHIKQEKDTASGSEETHTQFTQSPDWLIGSYEHEGSPLSNHIQPPRQEDLFPTQSELGGTCTSADHNVDSVIQSDSCTEDSDDDQLELGVQRTQPPVDQKLLVCGSCGRNFSSKRTLRKHIRLNTSPDQDQMSCSLRRPSAPFQSPAKSFSCRICGSSFYTQGILVRHAENHCKEPESRCGACGECLESTKILRDHLWSHKVLGSTCDVCGKKCSSIKRMEIHKRVHTGEKPYRCMFCSRDFSRKESLERHLKIHSGERPHSCGLCRRTFTRRENLVHHQKTAHTEKPGLLAGTESFSMTL